MIYFNDFKTDKLYSNDKFEKLKGYLGDKEARATLGEFLYNNLGVTVFLLTGGTIRLFPFQEIILRSWFDHNFNLNVVTRGGSKSYLASIFCWLYLIFNPGKRIVITSNAFRSSRRIMSQIERTANNKKATLLRNCFELEFGKIKMRRAGDEWVMNINEGSITGLPLNEKIRGTRADVLICDEFLMIPEDIYKSVLMPFLAAKGNITEQQRIQEAEDTLIAQGLITENERLILDTDKKIIGLTSASYDFEFIYRLYNQWIGKVADDRLPSDIRKKYFVSRLSYKALPVELIDQEITNEAKDGGEDTAAFKREFMALFSSSSDGYFNIKKLHDYTVKDGDLPCIQLRGNQGSKYILTIDPSFSSSKASDNFQMIVHLLNDEERTITQVHTYGVAGANLKDHINYLYYLLNNFNIVFIVADLQGENNNFITAANESTIFSRTNLKLEFIEGDFDSADYMQEVTKAKNSYNLTNKKICYRQKFMSDWIRKANEHLQTQIDKGKARFASRLLGQKDLVQKILEDSELPEYKDKNGKPVEYKDKNGKEMDILDFVSLQDEWIVQTKAQIALIEPKTTVNGVMQFDLPQNLKRSKNPERARKDGYSCTLMGSWGAKCYWDLTYTIVKKEQEIFMPIIIS